MSLIIYVKDRNDTILHSKRYNAQPDQDDKRLVNALKKYVKFIPIYILYVFTYTVIFAP